MTFYTYSYHRQRDFTPYYYGKGKNGRDVHNNHGINIPRKPDGSADRARILVQYWPDEATAFEMEKYYIRLFGRKDNGTGILRNLTDGGEGASGTVCSVETRVKLRDANLGKKLTQLTRDKISATNRLRGVRPTTTACCLGGIANRGAKRPPFSADARHNMSIGHLGHVLSQETKTKIAVAQTGVLRGPNTKIKSARAEQAPPNLGRRFSPEWCHSISEGRKGIKPSVEQINRMAIAQQARWARVREARETMLVPCNSSL